MAATFNALLDQPIVLLIVLAVGAAIGIGVEKFFVGIEREKRKAYWAGRKQNKGATIHTIRRLDTVAKNSIAADQLRTVMGAQFKPRPLLNKPERRY